MKSESKKRKLDITTGLFFLLFFAIWIFLFWKCRFGLVSRDESFYLTIPYRYCLGDGPLMEEWHVTQGFGWLMIPFMKAYLSFFPNTDGIYLSFRYLFTVVWGCSAIFFFYRLKPYSLWGAMLAAFLLELYAPLGIMALSYYTISILLLLSSSIILATSRKHAKLQYICAGILFAGAVLCCPQLLFLYLLYCISSLFSIVYGGIRNQLFQKWLYMSIGASLLFALFCVSLLRHAPLSKYLQTIPLILSDPRHPALAFSVRMSDLIYYLFYWTPYTFPAILLTIALTIICRKCTKLTEIGFVFVCAITTFLLQKMFLINLFVFPLSFLGLFCGICNWEDKEGRPFFLMIWIPGIVYAVCMSLASDQHIWVFASACVVSSVASAILAVRFLKQRIENDMISKGWKATMMIAFCIVTVMQLGVQTVSRYHTVFSDEDNGMKGQTAIIQDGPLKGIKCNPDFLNSYNTYTQDIEPLKSSADIHSVLFVSIQQWLYFADGKEQIPSWSACLTENLDLDIQNLDRYYSVFPEKKPDAIVVDTLYPYLTDVELFLERGYRPANYETSTMTIVLIRSDLNTVV